MPYGYLGTTPNQQLNNSGVFSVEEALALQNVGEFGGSLQHISTTNATASATIDIDIPSKYNVYLLQVNSIRPDDDSPTIHYQFFESGTIETASVYIFAGRVQQTDNQYNIGGGGGTGYIRLMGNIEGSDSFRASASIWIYNAPDSSTYTMTQHTSTYQNNADYYSAETTGGMLPQASVVDGIRFYSSNNQDFAAEGNFKLYGVTQI